MPLHPDFLKKIVTMTGFVAAWIVMSSLLLH